MGKKGPVPKGWERKPNPAGYFVMCPFAPNAAFLYVDTAWAGKAPCTVIHIEVTTKSDGNCSLG